MSLGTGHPQGGDSSPVVWGCQHPSLRQPHPPPLWPPLGAIPVLCPDRAKPASDSHSLAFSPPPALLSSLCIRGYLGPPHQGAPMHHMPGHDSRGPPHEMRGGPMGEPRPLMGEPRGPLMDARGERGGMKQWVVQTRSQNGTRCPGMRHRKGVWAVKQLTPGKGGAVPQGKGFLQA